MREPTSVAPVPTKSADRWTFAAVLLLALLMAAQLFAWSWQRADQSWWWMTHDRHSHYLFGLNLAIDVQQLDLPRLRHDLNAMRVWGPLHGLLEFVVQL